MGAHAHRHDTVHSPAEPLDATENASNLNPNDGANSNTAPHLSPQEELGALFFETRQRKNLTLRQVADKIHIRLSYLEYIESGALDQLPSHTYAVGFVRIYARYLGIDAQNILEKIDGFESHTAFSKPPSLQEPFSLAPSKFIVTLSGVLTVLSFGLAFFLLREESPAVASMPVVQDVSRMASAFTNSITSHIHQFLGTQESANTPKDTPSVTEKPATPKGREEFSTHNTHVTQASSSGLEATDPKTTAPDTPLHSNSAATHARDSAFVPVANHGALESPADTNLSTTLENNAKSVAADPATAEQMPPVAAAQTSQSAGLLTIFAKENSWVDIRTGSKIVFTGILKAKQTLSVNVLENTIMHTGNAPALLLKANEHTLPPLSSERMVMRHIKLKDFVSA